MFSNLLWDLIYFIKGPHVFIIFKCICIECFERILLILILNKINGLKGSKFVIMVKNKNVHLTII
jgi:hypothetical protein